MNKHQERGVSKGEIPHSLTHRFRAAYIARAVCGKSPAGFLPFDGLQGSLISNQQFYPIISIGYIIFSRLAYLLLTLSTDEPPKPAGKTDTPSPPTPGPIGRSLPHDFFPTFERTS